MTKFAALIPKTSSYLTHGCNESENEKGKKKSAIYSELKFEDYKRFLEINWLENKINYLEKNNIEVDSLKENNKWLLKDKRLILKSQRFRSRKDSAFTDTEEIAVSTNDDKIIQSIHFI